jgi:hypothetical protein
LFRDELLREIKIDIVCLLILINGVVVWAKTNSGQS